MMDAPWIIVINRTFRLVLGYCTSLGVVVFVVWSAVHCQFTARRFDLMPSSAESARLPRAWSVPCSSLAACSTSHYSDISQITRPPSASNGRRDPMFPRWKCARGRLVENYRCVTLHCTRITYTIAMLRMPPCLAKPLQHTYRLRR